MKKNEEKKPEGKKTAVPVIKAVAERRGLEMDINREEFAMALKTWRLRQGLTQEQVGERWGTSRYTIMRAEKAKDVTWMSAYKLFAKLAKELANENQE
mgnify:CR=1 FL=1